MEIRKPYDRVRSPANISSDSVTVKDAGNDTDINHIVARFKRTGEMPVGHGTPPQYGDVTALQGDLTEIIQKGREAEKELEQLQIQQDADQAEKLKTQEQRLKELEALHAQSQQTTNETNPDT